MNAQQKNDQMVQSLKNLISTSILLKKTPDTAMELQSNYYEINIIAQLLHDAEIITRSDFLEIVRLYPFIEPFGRLSIINDTAISFIESGPYSEDEAPTVIKTMYKIEKLSNINK